MAKMSQRLADIGIPPDRSPRTCHQPASGVCVGHHPGLGYNGKESCGDSGDFPLVSCVQWNEWAQGGLPASWEALEGVWR